MLRSEAAGGAAGLLELGQKTPAHLVVLEHLPDAPVTDDEGHDGQMFYAIATDLAANEITAEVVSPYRYRRILYPATASLGGLLGGTALLWSMILVGALAGGLASGATAAIADHLGMRPLTPLAATLNPGVLLSAMFLTADALAVGFGLLGVLLFLKSRDGWAICSLAAAGLTKETHILFAIGIAGFLLAGRQMRRSFRYLVLTAIPLALWILFMALQIGNPLEAASNLGLPFVGLYKASAIWAEAPVIEMIWVSFALAGLLLSVITVWRGHRFMAWLAAPWVALAVVSSHLIWDLGNNAIRTLAPLFILGVMGVQGWRTSRKAGDAAAFPD